MNSFSVRICRTAAAGASLLAVSLAVLFLTGCESARTMRMAGIGAPASGKNTQSFHGQKHAGALRGTASGGGARNHAVTGAETHAPPPNPEPMPPRPVMRSTAPEDDGYGRTGGRNGITVPPASR
jgi:hypothetical protein